MSCSAGLFGLPQALRQGVQLLLHLFSQNPFEVHPLSREWMGMDGNGMIITKHLISSDYSLLVIITSDLIITMIITSDYGSFPKIPY